MAENAYTADDFAYLLTLARRSIEAASRGEPAPSPGLDGLPSHLTEERACFVTLHKKGDLRGCIGVLQPRLSLVEEVIHSARSAALEDPRFAPLRPGELSDIAIEISILSIPEPLAFTDPSEIPSLLRPGIDGVILRRGYFRATFLPQVWDQLPDPIQFLEHLSRKMGLNKDAWCDPRIEVEIYQVVEFSE